MIVSDKSLSKNKDSYVNDLSTIQNGTELILEYISLQKSVTAYGYKCQDRNNKDKVMVVKIIERSSTNHIFSNSKFGAVKIWSGKIVGTLRGSSSVAVRQRVIQSLWKVLD